MIIDLILDRKDGEPYNPKDFYTNVLAYEDTFNFEPAISKAMDYGEEEDVKRALCDYINRQNYNPSICDYINSVNWLTSSKKAVKSAVNGLPDGSDYYEWVSYDVWGNEEDGWEVNDTSRFSDKRVVIHDDLTGLEVLKVLCAEGILNRQYINDVDVEFLDDYYIELTEKETGKPIGRLEKVQDIESSRKPIKSAVSDDKWELVNELCNRAIAEMNGDRDAMFFTKMSNGFLIKGKYIDEYESSTGITNPHKLWKKIVMILDMDELLPITEGTFRKYYELGVEWVGMNIQNSRKSIKSAASKELKEAIAGLNDIEDEFALVDYVKKILKKNGMSNKFEAFCDETDEADTPEELGKVAEKYIRMAIKSSRKLIKSGFEEDDELESEYNAGWDAFLQGIPRENCPKDTNKKLWLMGWDDCSKENDWWDKNYPVKEEWVLNSCRPIKSSTDWVNRVPDGINLFLYSKDNQAKDKRYFPVGDDWGQTDRLLYAKMFTKDGMQKALAAIEPQLPEGMSIQVRDAKGKVYYTYPNNLTSSRKPIKSSDTDRTYEEYKGNLFDVDKRTKWSDDNKINRELAGYFGKDKVQEFYDIVGNAKLDFDGWRIYIRYPDSGLEYYIKSDNGKYELHTINHQGMDFTVGSSGHWHGAEWFFSILRDRLPNSIESSFIVGKESNGGKVLYCIDNSYHSENDMSRPEIRIFNSKSEAEKIAKRSKTGFVQEL